jgi:hypothetical protein
MNEKIMGFFGRRNMFDDMVTLQLSNIRGDREPTWNGEAIARGEGIHRFASTGADRGW